MGGHIEKLGKSLGKSVESYNQAVASLETRVMVTARKFKDLEADAPGMEIERSSRWIMCRASCRRRR